MNAQLEKVFFKYILENKKYIQVVNPYFFRNNEIQFVYDVIKKYMEKSSDLDIPSARQMYDMISIEDKQGIITKDIFKTILKTDLSDYSEKDFIIPKFNTWVLRNRVKTGTVDIIDETRNLETITDYNQAIEVVNRITNITNDMTALNFLSDNDDDLGSDFDDAEKHSQDSSKYRVRSGFSTLDTVLGGGWDISTLNILMAMTNAGKSLWMQNLAVASSNLGYNVLYITLEMSERKVLKRLGSMRLNIPINQYDKLSMDTEYIKNKIDELKSSLSDSFFDKPIGKIITKYWSSGTATIRDFDTFITKLKEKRNIKIDLIFVDYIGLIATPGIDNFFLRGKFLAEGLRDLADRHSCPIVAGSQTTKDSWNVSDITIESIPESKAIADTADTVFGIIRTEEMKLHNIYRLKLLKQRDGGFDKSHMLYKLNPTYLTLEDDKFLD
jgi:replicative DNA helicase